MGLLSCLTDLSAAVATDTSTVINLNATGCAGEIIHALPSRLTVVDVVVTELEEGEARGRRDAAMMKELVAAGTVEIVRLDDEASAHFERLVVGPAAATVDDGEAATIAYAVRHKAVAIIDERKATRICADIFPGTAIGCSMDLLAHPEVQRQLGQRRLAEAIFNALYNGRMRVPPQHVEWVVGLIGRDKAAECSSLPRAVRRPQQRLMQARPSQNRVENG